MMVFKAIQKSPSPNLQAAELVDFTYETDSGVFDLADPTHRAQFAAVHRRAAASWIDVGHIILDKNKNISPSILLKTRITLQKMLTAI